MGISNTMKYKNVLRNSTIKNSRLGRYYLINTNQIVINDRNSLRIERLFFTVEVRFLNFAIIKHIN